MKGKKIHYVYNVNHTITMIEESEPSLSDYKKAIDCNRIQLTKFDNRVTIMYDEEGLLKNKEPNYYVMDVLYELFGLTMGDITLVGTVIVQITL